MKYIFQLLKARMLKLISAFIPMEREKTYERITLLLENAMSSIAEVLTKVNGLNDKIAGLSTKVDEIKAFLATLQAGAVDQGQIDSLSTAVDSVSSALDGLSAKEDTIDAPAAPVTGSGTGT